MFCGYCGKQIDDGSIFCPECGRSVENGQVVQQQPGSGSVGGQAAPTQTVPAQVASAQAVPAQTASAQAPVAPGAAGQKKKSTGKLTSFLMIVAIVVVVFAAIGLFAADPEWGDAPESMTDIPALASMETMDAVEYIEGRGLAYFEDPTGEYFVNDDLSSWTMVSEFLASLTPGGGLRVGTAEELAAVMPSVDGATPESIDMVFYEYGDDADSGAMSKEDLGDDKTHAGLGVGWVYLFETLPNDYDGLETLKAICREAELGEAAYEKREIDSSVTLLGEGEMYGEDCFWIASLETDKSADGMAFVAANVTYVTKLSFQSITNCSTLEEYYDFLNSKVLPLSS